MDAQEFLAALAKVVGVESTLDADGMFDLDVDGRLVTVRLEPPGDAWTYSTFVLTGAEAEPLPEALLRKALALNLMGAATNGHHLGLFGESLVLSGRVPGDGLDAEVFAEKLLLLVRTAARLSADLAAPAPSSAPLTGEGFLSV